MVKRARITKEIVENVKALSEKYPNITQTDLAHMAGTSYSAVSRIKSGHYDHLLEKPEPEEAEPEEAMQPEDSKLPDAAADLNAAVELLVEAIGKMDSRMERIERMVGLAVLEGASMLDPTSRGRDVAGKFREMVRAISDEAGKEVV